MFRRKFLKAAGTLSIASWMSSRTMADTQTSDYPEESISTFCRRLRPIGRILELEGYYVWCNTPIYGDDGKIHVFYSRWPSRKGMGGWINCSEIAHAVADSPEGPYTTVDVPFSPRGKGHWDATTCHNPHIKRVGDTFCLFYMGNSNGKTNTKRIGLAMSKSLDGPWIRPDAPLLEPGAEGGWDDHCTTNPSYIKHPNGESWLYYKSWNTADYADGSGSVRGNRKYGLAVAPSVDGPYKRHAKNPLVDFSGLGKNRQCEDAYVWMEEGRFQMIARDMGVFNHEVGMYLESSDGIQWSAPKIAYYDLAQYFDEPPAPKHLRRYGRLERPQLLFQGDRPTHLFGASQGGKYQTASGLVLALAAK